MSVTAGPAFLHAREPDADGVPAPGESLFRRYLAASVASSATPASGAAVTLRGVVRVGERWLPYRAVEVVTPGHGFTRVARVAGVVEVDDVAVPGEVVHRVRLAGRTLREDAGEDVARRAVGELALATIWAPSALAARPDVRRVATGASSVHVTMPAPPGSVLPQGPVGGAGVTMRLHRRGLPMEVRAVHWGDPTGGARPGPLPFGGPILEHRTWSGVTVPATGVLGWFPGTARWTEVLRWQLTAWEPSGGGPAVW